MFALLPENNSPSRHYVNLSIRLNVQPTSPLTLKAEVTCHSAAVNRTVSDDVHFKIAPHELREAYDSVRSANQHGAMRRGMTPLLDPVKDLGSRMFNSLFHSELGAVYRESVSHADDMNARLRICISATSGTLIDELPWEFLYDPRRNDFLALSSRRPIVRQVVPTTAFTDIQVADTLRIAFFASPDPDGYFAVERDWETLRQIAESAPGRLSISRITIVSPSDFFALVTSSDYEVLHFAGHAIEQWPGVPLSPQALLLSDSDPSGMDALLADMLMRTPSTMSGPQLLCLNACNTHRLAQHLATQIPNVIGMRELVSSDFCVTFANGFYRSLVTGVSIEEAITAARALSDTVNPGGREWGMATFCTSAREPVKLASTASRSIRTSQEEDLVAPSDPGRAREWRKLKQQLEVNQRNHAALSDLLEGLTKAEEFGTMRTINQGAAKNLKAQFSKLDDIISEIHERMRDLGG